MPSELPSVKDLIDRHELFTKKSLGQHFLLDEHLTAKIAQAAGDLSQCSVIEIGPGPGGLTRALLNAGAKHVIAIEKDRRCVAALQELQQAFPDRLAIIEADAMKVELPALAPAPRKIVANLPYNVGTALLLNWLEDVYLSFPRKRESIYKKIDPRVKPEDDMAMAYDSMTLMFQREVAERLMAKPGGKEYGRLSVMAQWLCKITHHFDLPPGAFTPPPKIYSSVITFIPRPAPLCAVPKEALEKVLLAAFGQRRKMLRQSLKLLGGEKLLAKASIDGTRRAETLSVEEFCVLAEQL